MKKYQQLVLVILSIFSFISLLIYRHEYNKLHYVLEVFNFFGTPGIGSHKNFAQNISLDRYLMSEPLPAWQRLSDTLYLYSAYWEIVNNKGYVVAPAVGLSNEKQDYGCRLWYELYPDSVKGEFRSSELHQRGANAKIKNGTGYMENKSVQTQGFLFYCDTVKEEIPPIGVTFYKIGDDEASQAFLPVYKIKTDSPVQNSTAVCVLPNEYTYLKKLNYLEFLSFHRAIGLKDYIIYGANLQYNIITPILKNSSYDVNIMVLHWNYPFYGDFKIMTDIATHDCIARATGLYEHVIVLKWNQFFVPKSHSSAQTIISNLDPEKKFLAFEIDTALFCLEFKDDPLSNKTLPTVFRKTGYVLSNADPVIVFNTKVNNVMTKQVSRDLITIHWYAKCSAFLLKSKKKIDSSMLMFKSEIMQSKLMTL